VTSPQDISTRLLEAIAKAEQQAIGETVDVMVTVYLDTQTDLSSWYQGHCECGWLTSDSESAVHKAARSHVADRHPSSMLGFCRAHREVVELAMVCRADYGLAAEAVASSLGINPSEHRELEARSLAALTRLQTLELVMSSIASAYGIEPSHVDEATETAASRSPLRSHYGPTDTDPDPGKRWCYDCGSEVYGFKEGDICSGCERVADDG